jgi:chemotaxis response regulator CheB
MLNSRRYFAKCAVKASKRKSVAGSKRPRTRRRKEQVRRIRGLQTQQVAHMGKKATAVHTRQASARCPPECCPPFQGATQSYFPIVGIGASAGGLEAFTRLLEHLPTDTGMGFVLVQHCNPQHARVLTQLLTRATTMSVREVNNNLCVEPNQVYVISPNTNLSIERGVLKLQSRPEGHAPHRSIDSFFESLAQDQHERAIGVILSGTATVGTVGLESIKAEGGITFAQDNSAKYDSMPRSAATAGCVDFVVSPENIAKELARIARHPYVAGKRPGGEAGWAVPAAPQCADVSQRRDEDTAA